MAGAMGVGHPTLLISAFVGPSDPPSAKGGLYKWEAGDLSRVDSLPTAGLCVHRGKLVRGLRNKDRAETPSALLVYEHAEHADGPRSVSLADVASLHDVCSTPEGIAVVATSQNRVVWVDEAGTELRSWQPSMAPDSWHLNSLYWTGKTLVASAFGRYDHIEAWREHWSDRQGVLVDVATGKVILDGLMTPHSPRLLAEGWLVCQSRRGLVTVGDRVADLRGWTRGVAVTPDRFYVGVSAHFFPKLGATDISILPELSRAKVVVLDRETLAPLDEIVMPAGVRHIYDVVAVDGGLV